MGNRGRLVSDARRALQVRIICRARICGMCGSCGSLHLKKETLKIHNLKSRFHTWSV